jgi:hypothetical protein
MTPAENRASVPKVGYENDRMVERPSSQFSFFYFLLIREWFGRRGAMVQADSDAVKVAGMVFEEVLETLEELDRNVLDLELLTKEQVDILVLTMAISINKITRFTGKIPDFNHIETSINGQAPSADIYVDKMAVLTKPENIDSEDNESLMAMVTEMLILTGSFINHGPAYPDSRYMKRMMVETHLKNDKNYPAEYLSKYHWLDGRELTVDELEQEHVHARKAMKLIRLHTGNDTNGLKREYHRPYRYLIHDFENSEKAIAQLEALLVSGHLKTVVSLVIAGNYNENLLTVYPEYRNQAELLVRPNDKQVKVIFDATHLKKKAA